MLLRMLASVKLMTFSICRSGVVTLRTSATPSWDLITRTLAPSSPKLLPVIVSQEEAAPRLVPSHLHVSKGSAAMWNTSRRRGACAGRIDRSSPCVHDRVMTRSMRRPSAAGSRQHGTRYKTNIVQTHLNMSSRSLALTSFLCSTLALIPYWSFSSREWAKGPGVWMDL